MSQLGWPSCSSRDSLGIEYEIAGEGGGITQSLAVVSLSKAELRVLAPQVELVLPICSTYLLELKERSQQAKEEDTTTRAFCARSLIATKPPEQVQITDNQRASVHAQ